MFLDCGYSPPLYWSLGIDEITDLVESYGRRMEHEQERRRADTKDEIMLMWNQCQQLMNMAAHSMHPQDVELKPPHEYYPDLFKEEAETSEEEKTKNELALHKARMEEYAYRHNRARERDTHGRNDTGKAPGNNTGTD